MIGYLKNHEKIQCRSLWEEAFPEDSKSFDDYYFSEKIKDNRILVLQDEEQIASMVHRNPYTISIRGQSTTCDYIVGVATAANQRRKGYMRQLLCRMLKDQMEEQMPFCFLMPANAAIYQPFDFGYIFDQPNQRLSPAVLKLEQFERKHLIPWSDSIGGRSYLAGLAAWMNDWLGGRYQVYAKRDERYLRRLLKELASEKGTFDVLYDAGSMIGVHSEWGQAKREQRLLYCEPQYILEETAKPAIMARIVCLKEFLRWIRLTRMAAEQYSERMIPIRVTDELLEENNGSFNWHLNRERSWIEPLTGEEPELSLTISEMTQWLFGYCTPESVECYNDTIETLQSVFLDEIV